MRIHLLALVLLACGPTPPAVTTWPAPTSTADELPPPNPVVVATDEDARACRRLGDLGCPEAAMCLGTMSVARTDHIPVPSACLAAAADVAAVRRCGDSGTLTFTCAR